MPCRVLSCRAVRFGSAFCLFLEFYFHQLITPQKGEKKKKKKKVSNTDTLQEQRKNKKEMEFELKLAKEKEEMYEREKQLKINRLVQEVLKEEYFVWILCVKVDHILCLFIYCGLHFSSRSLLCALVI